MVLTPSTITVPPCSPRSSGDLSKDARVLPVSSRWPPGRRPGFLAELRVRRRAPSPLLRAVLHLGSSGGDVHLSPGTALAKVIHFRSDPEGRKIAIMVAIGTDPAVVFGLHSPTIFDRFRPRSPTVAAALIGDGVILFLGASSPRASPHPRHAGVRLRADRARPGPGPGPRDLTFRDHDLRRQRRGASTR